MEFKDIIMRRYATKRFEERTIPEEKMSQLLEMIRFAPSALNLQPWKIKVISDRKLKEELFPATFNQEQIKSCSHLLVFCADIKVEPLIEKLGRIQKDAGIPDEIRNSMNTIAKHMFGMMSPDNKIEWAKCQVYLALANAVYGAKSLGLDSCPMTGFDPAAYSRILKLPDHLIPTILCALGYAADKPMVKVRFSTEDIFF